MFIFPQEEVGLHLAGMLHGLGYVLHWIVRVRGSSQGAEITTENQAIAECCGTRIGGRMILRDAKRSVEWDLEPEPSWDPMESRFCRKLWIITFVRETCYLQCRTHPGSL